MAMFVDAYDWVMVPNVYAMSQFAAGTDHHEALRLRQQLPAQDVGPALRGSGCLLGMVCTGRSLRITGRSWGANPRMRMVLSQLEDMDPDTRDGHRRRAAALLDVGHDTTLLRTTPAPAKSRES